MIRRLLENARSCAQHQTYRGSGVVCDEPQQVAQHVRSQKGDGMLAAINAEKP
jgi:hypothetical protein